MVFVSFVFISVIACVDRTATTTIKQWDELKQFDEKTQKLVINFLLLFQWELFFG